MKYTLFLIVPLFLFLFSCSEIKPGSDNGLIPDGVLNKEKNISSKDSADFKFKVQYIDSASKLVYSSSSYIYVGNNNDPNYGNLSLYSAIRLIPYNNDYNKKYGIENVKKILGAHLVLYGYSKSFDSDSAKALTIQIRPLSEKTTFSELSLNSPVNADATPVGDTTFINNVRANGKFSIPISDTNYVRKVLTFNSKTSTSDEYNNNIFGFLIKANNTATSKTQGFYGYGSTYPPEMIFDIIVDNNGVPDTIVADFTTEAVNQLSSFEKLGNWNLGEAQEADKIKIVNFSGLRAKITFSDLSVLPKNVSLISGTFSIQADTILSKCTNSKLISFYGASSTNDLVSPSETKNPSSDKYIYTFSVPSWIQFWSLQKTNYGFYLISPYERSSVENFTLNLNNSSDASKRANLELTYVER